MICLLSHGLVPLRSYFTVIKSCLGFHSTPHTSGDFTDSIFMATCRPPVMFSHTHGSSFVSHTSQSRSCGPPKNGSSRSRPPYHQGTSGLLVAVMVQSYDNQRTSVIPAVACALAIELTCIHTASYLLPWFLIQ